MKLNDEIKNSFTIYAEEQKEWGGKRVIINWTESGIEKQINIGVFAIIEIIQQNQIPLPNTSELLSR